MRRGGRPLRFLGATLGGWVVLRVGMLWPTIETPHDLIRLFAPPAAAAIRAPLVVIAVPPRAQRAPAIAAAEVAPVVLDVAPRRVAADRATAVLAEVGTVSVGQDAGVDQAGAIPPPLRPTPADAPGRLTASAWAIVRAGVAAGLRGGQLGSQLGGSQAGVRFAYALGESRRLALAARLSAPLEGRGGEAAIGVEFRPAHLPLRFIAEQRVALDGGRGGQALYAVGGTAPVPVAAGFRLEGYAQGGVVVRGRALGFADGAARLTRPVTRTFDIGVGAWAGVQPGVARVDVGPTLGVALPVARRRIRVSLDWRQRVGGRARPGSGPALSIGGDF
ncbi:hypothetical protein [Sphingomonas sp.]|uniref:hypothetical protein n=1 Tax=Sphingomonas sp. TaxID=28214 RepID=UPI0035BBF2A2